MRGTSQHHHIAVFVCRIAITSIRQTSTSTVYECLSRGKAGEFVYWLSVSREAPEGVEIKAGDDVRLYEYWDNFSIDYMPVDVASNRAIFQNCRSIFRKILRLGVWW